MPTAVFSGNRGSAWCQALCGACHGPGPCSSEDPFLEAVLSYPSSHPFFFLPAGGIAHGSIVVVLVLHICEHYYGATFVLRTSFFVWLSLGADWMGADWKLIKTNAEYCGGPEIMKLSRPNSGERPKIMLSCAITNYQIESGRAGDSRSESGAMQIDFRPPRRTGPRAPNADGRNSYSDKY